MLLLLPSCRAGQPAGFKVYDARLVKRVGSEELEHQDKITGHAGFVRVRRCETTVACVFMLR